MGDIPWSGADTRTEEAQQLIDQAANDVIPLALVAAIHLCLLGAQAYSMFDEVPARAYAALSNRKRRQFVKAGIDSLQRRGLLLEPEVGHDDYPVSPKLGLILAAMAGPPFVAATTAANLRSIKVFPLADLGESPRAMVVEVPAKMPNPKRDFGVLGAAYDYELMSPAFAAKLLAEFMTHADSAPRKVTVFHPGEQPLQQTVTVLGNGTTAVLLGPDGQPISDPLDKAALAEVIGQTFR